MPQPAPSASAPSSGKTFVLDTNVLIHDPESMFRFQRSAVVLPLTVIEELDQFKRLKDDRGVSVRRVIRLLDRLRSGGKLTDGVPLQHGGRLSIEYRKLERLPLTLGNHSAKKDNEILATALYLKEKGQRVVLISKDINLRIKAEVLGLEVEDYEREKAPVESLHKGWKELTASPESIDRFYRDRRLANFEGAGGMLHNDFVILKSEGDRSQSALARFKPPEGLVPLEHAGQKTWGIQPLNVQQKFAVELLLDKSVNLAALVGVPGSGKTLLSLAAGLEQTIEHSDYRRLLISRPIIPVGRDIGYLPGDKQEKLATWMGAIKDNIEFLCDVSGKSPSEEIQAQAVDILQSDKIEIEAVSFLRGRSLPGVYFIIDDAQNLTPHEIKTIISRAGEGTKVVLTGDPYQIDNPYLDASSNGLSNLVDRFKGQPIFGVVKFDKTERSRLADLAGKLL
ncbi:MAG: PhoH family protein [Elusimicrobia bacterium]|nr:PhoH family protein [Elusimicrobiota bacterium]